MNRIYAHNTSISDWTQSTLIFGGLCLCALQFSSLMDTRIHSSALEEVKVAQYEESIGGEDSNPVPTCAQDDESRDQNDASDSACKTTH
ncbi:MAG TPA: hypothetical protein VM432_10845 [Bdellovibrionales bacterium]|nr:hypothetical protein [Bdellovibrionales bacterium]